VRDVSGKSDLEIEGRSAPAGSAEGRAYSRVGILGNPSDGYGGSAIAASVYDFGARVKIVAADRFRVRASASDELDFPHAGRAWAALTERGCDGGARLLCAALKRFFDRHPELATAPDSPKLRFELSYQSNVPRQVGLSGSSAIVIATLRALSSWFEIVWPPDVLAEEALLAEVQELGIAAGPMDRVVQAYEGLLYMDFAPPRSAERYERLDLSRLPPLFVAWQPNPGVRSGLPHSNVRARFERGDSEVIDAMTAFAELAKEGRRCLQSGDHARFAELVDQNFDLRGKIFPLGEQDLRLVAIGRAEGAAVKMSGSGGAVVGVLRSADDLPRLRARYHEEGFHCRAPKLECS